MTRQPPPVPAPGRGTGFTLVEVLVSLAVLSIALLALAPLSLLAARRASELNGAAYETGVLAAEVGRLDVLPYAQLAPGTTCTTVSTPPFPHTRCTTVNDISAKQKQVIVVVTPSGNALLQPDTTVIERTNPGNGSPLDSP
jgi:prepilin-type N-terminal cleavage/methylation domain-containing protein